MEGQPEIKNEPATQPEKGHKKGEPREKKPKIERKSQYVFNSDLIDENTVIPPLPKKNQIIPKPDINVIKDKEAKISHRIEEIINKKKEVRTEKFKFNRKAHGEGESKHSTFQSEVSEVGQLREKLIELKVERTKLRDSLHNAIEQSKANNINIKEYREALKGCRENFSDRLRELEHKQMTKELSKDEEKNLNTEIMMLKRKIREAESSGNIEMKLEQAEDLKDELDDEIEKIKKEKDPIEKEYSAIKEQLDKRNEKITGIKNEMNAEKNQKTEEKEKHDKEYEAWKELKKVRLEKLEAEIVKLRQDNTKLWDSYHKNLDDYWKQKFFIDWVEWQTRQKNRKLGDKEREARKAEYEKKDKEREKEQQLQKYIGQIQLINFLINYLNNLKTDNTKVEEKKVKVVVEADVAAKLAEDAQWKKEKGVEILKSKKSKEDEEPEKKNKKKNKKKEEVKQQEKFNIPFQVQNMFESIKILSPTSAEEIDAKIKQLQQREALFERVAKEESNEEEKKIAEEIKGKKEGKAKPQAKAKKVEDEEFPTI